MSQILVCASNDVSVYQGMPSCTDWQVLPAEIVVKTASESVTGSELALAFGSGFGVVMPVLLLIWGIKMAKKSLKIS